MLERILVPLDGSTFAEFALSPALEIARRADAVLELFTVAEAEPVLPDRPESTLWTAETARGYLDDLSTALSTSWEGRIETGARQGYPAAAIEARAKEASPDLVVLSSHGRGPFSRFWLGSVADALLRRAPCPVLVVRPDEGRDPAPDEGFDAERILVPIDGSEVSRSVVEHAVELGALFDARLHLVNCLPTLSYGGGDVHPYLSRPSDLDDGWLREEMRQSRERLETLAERLRDRDVEAEVSVIAGEGVAECILRTADSWGADLVALGTHGRGGVRRTVLGSVADKVVRAARIPVLAFRPVHAR